MRLTERTLKAKLPMPPERAELSDDEVKGLTVRGNRREARWVVRRVLPGGTRKRVTIGTWPGMSAAAAREQARAAIAGLANGAPIPAVPALSVSAMLEEWEQAHRHLRTTQQRASGVRYVFKLLLERDVRTLDTPDYLRVADRHPARGSANRTLRDLRAILRWAATRDLAPEGVLQNVKLQRGGQRDHVPTLEEMKLAWQVLAALLHKDAPGFRRPAQSGDRPEPAWAEFPGIEARPDLAGGHQRRQWLLEPVAQPWRLPTDEGWLCRAAAKEFVIVSPSPAALGPMAHPLATPRPRANATMEIAGPSRRLHAIACRASARCPGGSRAASRQTRCAWRCRTGSWHRG